MNISEAKHLFKKMIQTVEIGLHSYCNRTCDFCPLSRDDVNRNSRDNVKYMNDEIFKIILNDLNAVEFDGRIDISRYHEPLYNKKFILDKIKEMSVRVPKALISINSNADYISQAYIEDLINHNVGHINLMAYMNNGATDYDANSVFKRINQICKKINVKEINPEEHQNKDWIRYRLPEIKSTIHARNYWNNGVNRAGSILDKNYIRKDPCTSFNHGIFIDYDGTMTICCDMLAPELHNKWLVGDLNIEKSLFLNYGSDYYQEFLTRINSGNFFKGSPCESCRRKDRGKNA